MMICFGRPFSISNCSPLEWVGEGCEIAISIRFSLPVGFNRPGSCAPAVIHPFLKFRQEIWSSSCLPVFSVLPVLIFQAGFRWITPS